GGARRRAARHPGADPRQRRAGLPRPGPGPARPGAADRRLHRRDRAAPPRRGPQRRGGAADARGRRDPAVTEGPRRGACPRGDAAPDTRAAPGCAAAAPAAAAGVPGRVRPAQRADTAAVGRRWRALIEEHARRDAAFALRPGAEAELPYAVARLLARPDTDALLVWEAEGRVRGFCAARLVRAPPAAVERRRAEIT